MIWTIIKADMLWMAIVLPLQVIVQVAVVLWRRRQQNRSGCEICDWRRKHGANRRRLRHWR